MSDPDSQHIRHCLNQCEFMILQEIFPSETALYADVLLPGVSFAEKSGTFTNTERRIQMVNQAIDPPGEAMPDWQIIAELAKTILSEGKRTPSSGRFSAWGYSDTSQIMEEIAALTPSYAGITHERLRNGDRLQWPVKSETDPGTPILHMVTSRVEKENSCRSSISHRRRCRMMSTRCC